MNIIQTEKLTKYYGSKRGIIDVDLEVKKGEIFGFIGPNGAGKSTTIRILLNLLYPSGGRAEIFGMDVCKRSKEIKRRIGYLPSESNFYDRMHVMEYLQYAARYHQQECDDRIKELAENFEVDLKAKITDLSTGNKKKVSILQSLIHHPELLILDEPTNGLDPLIQSRFFEVLRAENSNGTTILFSSHILSEVQKLCKRVAIIKNGRIITVEDIESMRQKNLKKIKIEFDKALNQKWFGLQGVSNITRDENTITFSFSGDINNLIEILNNKRVNDLVIEEPSLEEIFMHYYEGERDGIRS
jgi:ABC-2 type transport system ATP-binding protein